MNILRVVFAEWLKRPISTGMTLFGIAVTLTLPMLLHTLVVNLGDALQGWSDRPGIVLYLNKSVSEVDIANIHNDIVSKQNVDEVTIIDKQQGLEQLIQNALSSTLWNSSDSNPLPDVIVVHPVSQISETDFYYLSNLLGKMNGVDDVQVDLEWLQQVSAITDLAYQIVFIFWLLLFCGIGIIISNTVRFIIAASEDEIRIISLVGGTWNYIRHPFLVRGLLLGFIGSCISILLFFLCLFFLKPLVENLVVIYQSDFNSTFIPGRMILNTLILATLMGGLVAWLTVTHFLRTADSRL